MQQVIYIQFYILFEKLLTYFIYHNQRSSWSAVLPDRFLLMLLVLTIQCLWLTRDNFFNHAIDVSRPFGRPICLGAQNLAPKKHLFFIVFYFQLYLNKSSDQWFNNVLFRNRLEDKNEERQKKNEKQIKWLSNSLSTFSSLLISIYYF